ncbi:MAG TPA: bifunctional adenosylcobinamide kinase/adenosylcobinamide-phosphate guanylyltransferase [Deltaproteobacteria bacterium]|nr:bifunctional adenosylcobinamide kinase/adenosylcobinamide-phosphate guanylyltransferase [Deltaproteobacteria bacterium]
MDGAAGSGRRLVFVLGGARSGKSAFAQRLCESLAGGGLYLATARALDDEMRERIRRHRSSRSERWTTVEEPLRVVEVLEETDAPVVLLDCLTLWLSNLLGAGLDDRAAAGEAERLVRLFGDDAAAHGPPQTVVAVSNEVGLGIVPENALARRFRDLAGSVNRTVAAAAHEVHFIAAGLPVRLK